MKRVVIVGAGHAAGQLVATLRQKKFPGQITLLGEEPWYPYQRPPLSKKYLAGDMSAERLFVKPQSFYDDPNIEVRLDTRVTEIDRNDQSVRTAAGESYHYDSLVIATGSRPRKIDLPGSDLAGEHYLRGIADVDAIRARLDDTRHIVIVGAGYIGLEVAAVLAQLGHVVSIVEMTDRVMSRVVSPQISKFFQDVHTENGVNLKLSAEIKRLIGRTQVKSVELTSGEQLSADIVVIGIGIVPNVELATAAELETNNGILVDDHCRSGDANIYSVGDCTMHPNAILRTDLRLESVHNALEQAKTAASNICGDDISYAQVPWFWSDQYDLKLQIAGLSQGYDEALIRGSIENQSFSCLYLAKGILIAVDAVNCPKDFIQSKALIAGHARIDQNLLMNPDCQLKDLDEPKKG